MSACTSGHLASRLDADRSTPVSAIGPRVDFVLIRAKLGPAWWRAYYDGLCRGVATRRPRYRDYGLTFAGYRLLDDREALLRKVIM